MPLPPIVLVALSGSKAEPDCIVRVPLTVKSPSVVPSQLFINWRLLYVKECLIVAVKLIYLTVESEIRLGATLP